MHRGNPKGIQALLNCKRCSHIRTKQVDGRVISSPCGFKALRNFSYCYLHIHHYPDENEKYMQELQTRKSNKIPKYNFLKRAFPESYNQFYNQNNLLDLKNEVALLSALLNKLYSMNLNSIDNMKVLDMQIKIINQIRLLIKTMKEIEVDKKAQLSYNDLKLFMVNVGQVIKDYVSDKEVLSSIGKKVLELYSERNQSGPEDSDSDLSFPGKIEDQALPQGNDKVEGVGVGVEYS